MKTTISKLMYVVLISVIAAFASCKGEIGPVGPAGANGTDGTNGTNGTDGTDGTDGNANVQTYVYNNPIWSSGSFMYIAMDDILTADVIANDAILGYVNFGNDTYAIPGIVWNGENKQFKVYFSASDERLTIASHELDGTYTPIANLFEVSFVKIIVIESTGTTTTDGNGKSLSPRQIVYDELKNAGVDVNDYYQVMDYYGLEY